MQLNLVYPDLKMSQYDQAMFKANYYRWSASKRSILPGNEPITGLPRSNFYLKEHSRNEAAVAYKAMAKYWLGVARNLREKGINY